MNAERDVTAGISDRDAQVVRAIEEEGLSIFTFDGIRRITGAHPETLSRVLERLEEDGMVVRSPEGYSTTDKAKEAVGVHPAYVAARRVPILRTYLPYGASVGGLVSALRGRWFDKLRWVGLSEAEDGVVLKWVTDDGSTVIDAKLSMGMLDVEAKLKNEGDLQKAVRAAHQLVGRISRLYAGPRPGNRAMLMETGYFSPYAM